ncbi:hypothetical protein OZ410_07430 [Robiginitalea sp. M366]|uniref:hypothetical protein n=1 Tax=Robiginitalea aestuariiviva TaxID=3036903 RepID=UPI00240DC690|nr:hypothetical protein [Robiginitalea aestuariiviva]MDG1572143.1 hypothetical protein [Robiginitalea aestuariiviva]
MKKFLYLATYTLLLFGALSLTSCQEEFEEVNTSNTAGVSFKASSETAILIEKTSSRDGSFDNIVDRSSCFALNFPYTVNVNGIDITIDSKEDLELIEEIFDEFEDDLDVLEIVFPITITLADHSVIVIENRAALEELAQTCVEGGDDDDIECIDFVYPVTFYTFDINNTQTGTVTVENDEQMRRFFDELDEDDIVSLEYPVTLIKFDGTEIQVNSNAELAAALRMAKDACDEDDDDDYNDDDFTVERLSGYLVECPWIVTRVERNDVDQTGQYEAYKMTFSETGMVEVKDREGNVLMGEWALRMSDRGVLLTLGFETLVDFNLVWKVCEVGEGKIKLYEEGGNRIIMERMCDNSGGVVLPETLAQILRECSWIIKTVKNQGEEIDRLIGYEFQFQGEGVVTLSNGITVNEGTWEIGTAASGELALLISMGAEPGVSFEWPLRDLTNTRLKFRVDEIDYELILERVCANATDGDVAEIRNIMMGGNWTVASYVEGDMDTTADYAGYDFAFGAEHILSVSTNMDPVKDGLWRVIRDHDGQLKVYLNLGADADVFADLTDDWDFVSITANRLEVKDVSGDGTVTVLVFEK